MLVYCNYYEDHGIAKTGYLGISYHSSASISWRRRSLKSVLRSDLDKLIQRAFLPTCAGTTIPWLPCTIHLNINFN